MVSVFKKIHIISATLFISCLVSAVTAALNDTSICQSGIVYGNYTETCSLISDAEQDEDNYGLVQYDGNNQSPVNLDKDKLNCDSDIIIFIGDSGPEGIDNEFVHKLIGGCSEEDELVLGFTWGLKTEIDDCGDLDGAAVNAGRYLVHIIEQLDDLGADIDDIRIVTVGAGFAVALEAANKIANNPQKVCLKYIAGIQPTLVPYDASSISCKSIALYDSPGDYADIKPKATVNIIYANSVCNLDNPNCYCSIPNADRIVKLFHNHVILYKSNSWQDALAGKSLSNKIEIQFASLSPGYYITNPSCTSGNVNKGTIKNTTNYIVSDNDPFDSFCGCSVFDYNNLQEFCSVKPTEAMVNNTNQLLNQHDYFFKLIQLTSMHCPLDVDECPNLIPGLEPLIVIGDALNASTSDYGNPGNKNFYFSSLASYAPNTNYILFAWTYSNEIEDCKELSQRIQEAGYYVSLFLKKFSSCGLPFSEQRFIAFGNGNHILATALDLLDTNVQQVIAIRPTAFPIWYGDNANKLIAFHQNPGVCSSWYPEGQINIVVNDPDYPCDDDKCGYGINLVNYVFQNIKQANGFALYRCNSWADAIANVASNNNQILVNVTSITDGFYITNLNNVCPPASNPGSSSSGGLINLDVGLLNKLF